MKYRPPTVREFLILTYSENTAEIVDIARNIAEISSFDDFRSFLTEYLTEIETIRSQNVNLQVPYYPEHDEQEHYYNCNSSDIKIVSNYTGLNFLEIYELDIFIFWSWLHDAVVWNCEKTEDGRNYLEKAWAGSQKEPDREALRLIFG